MVSSTQDAVTKLSKLTAIREDVVRAANIDEKSLTALFNKASSANKWLHILGLGLCAFMGTPLIAHTFFSPPSPVANLIFSALILGGTATTVFASIKSLSYGDAKKELRTLIDDRFVALAKTDDLRRRSSQMNPH